MPKLIKVVKSKKPTTPEFLARVQAKKQTAIQPPVVASAGGGLVQKSKLPAPAKAAVKLAPIAKGKQGESPVMNPGKTSAHLTGLSAVRQDRAVNEAQGIEAGGTAKAAIFHHEIRKRKLEELAQKSPLVAKMPAPPSANIVKGKKVITSAFQQSIFRTPFQKNVNLRRGLSGIY